MAISQRSLWRRACRRPLRGKAANALHRIAIQGDILGGAAMGVCNMLCLTGDGVQVGDHPQSKPVFDLDSMSLLGIARDLRDERRFQSGRKITAPPQIFLGAVENPFAPPCEWRPHRLVKRLLQAPSSFRPSTASTSQG